MITVFTILGTRHYLLDYPNLHDTYNELRTTYLVLLVVSLAMALSSQFVCRGLSFQPITFQNGDV